MSNATAPGTYKARLADMKFGESGKGTPQMEFVLDVQVSTNDIRRRSIIGYLSEKAAQYTEEHLRRLEFNGDFDQPACDSKWYGTDEVPWPIEVYCKHEDYQNAETGETKTAERWNFSTMNRTKPADDNVRALAAQRWRAKNGSAPTAAPRPSSPPPASKGPPPAVEAPKPSGPPGEAPPSPWTKERAWQRYEDATGGKPDPNAWTKAVQAVLNGRRESQLTSDEWRGIAETLTESEIPF